MGLFSRRQEALTLVEKIEKSIQIYFDYSKRPNKIERQIGRIAENEEEHMQLYLFIPMCFCREFIPEVEYSDIYITSDNGMEKENQFSDSDVFMEITKVVKKNWNTYSGEDTMKVLIYSSDLDAINNALNSGSKLEDLKSIPVKIL